MKKQTSVRKARKQRIALVVSMMLVWSMAFSTVYGVRDTDHKKDKTLRGSSRINPSTLAMEFSLPLGVYPGRAGNSIPITLNYSSKVWTMRQLGYAKRGDGGMGTTVNPFLYTTLETAIAEYGERTSAGWTSTLQPISIIPEGYHVSGQDGPFPTQDHLGDETEEANGCRLVGVTEQPPDVVCTGGRIVYDYMCPNEVEGGPDVPFQVTVCTMDQTPPTGIPNLPILGDEDLSRTTRVRLQLSDGSTHEFRKDDVAYNCAQVSCDFNWNGTYLAVDGSGMRFVRGELVNGDPRDVLYLPDGGRFTMDLETGAQEYIDRNGNKSAYVRDTHTWTDTMGRGIIGPLPHSTNGGYAPGTYVKSLPSIEGDNRQYTQKWQSLKPDGCVNGNEPICQEAGLENVNDELYYVGDNSSEILAIDNPVEPSLFEHAETHVVPYTDQLGKLYYITKTYRVLPGGAPFNPGVLTELALPNGTSYRFRYNRYGEITKIIYPTGAYERFRYDAVPSLTGNAQAPFSHANRGVVERWLSLDGVTETQNWKYSVTYATVQGEMSTLGLTIAPDGTRTQRTIFNSGGAPFGFDDPRNGMPIDEKIYSPSCEAVTAPITSCDSHLISRTLNKYIVAPPRGSNGNVLATRDPRPSMTVSIRFEPGAPHALATLSTVEYDSHTDQEYFAHLNPIRQQGYHFKAIDLTTARSGDITTIAALFGSSDIASISETDYLYDPNYKAHGITSLPIRTRVLDPADPDPDNPLAKTETIYDNAVPSPNSNYPYSVEAYSGAGNLLDCATSSPAKICWQNPNGTGEPINLAFRGLPTTSRLWNAGTGEWIETHTRYDQFGNAVAVDDPTGNETTTAFASLYKYAYPTSVITPAPDPTGVHGTTETSTVSTTYDFNTGLPLSVTDDFGQVTTTEYSDALLRPTKVNPVVINGSPTGPVAETIYDDVARTVKVRKQLDAVNWDEATTYFDGLGRTIKTVAKDSQGDVIVETEYDNMGRVKRVTNPYRQGETKLWTTTDYDELGRVKFVTTPDNARVETQYGLLTSGTEIGTTTTVIDQALKQRRSITNALGQLIRVDEPNLNNELGSVTSPNQATRYLYNAQGKMVRVQQGVQNRYFMYDALGRMIRVRQPEQEINAALETTGNPDNNSWTAGFTYDVLGNILTSTDAKGTIITNTYDRANRVTTRVYSNEPPGVATPNVSLFYDGKGLAQTQSPNFAKGKLTNVTSSVSETQYSLFDNFGRLTESKQITDGNIYTSSYQYNLSGALIQETYPSGRVVKNEFETDGDLARIFGKPNPTATEQMYATAFSYFPDGKIEKLKLGNGLWESAKLNNRLQVTEIAMGHSVADGSLMKLNYEYGELSVDGAAVEITKNAGNIARQTVNFSGLTHPFVQTFRYDSLDRVTEAVEKVNGVQTWKQTFGYDIYGNRNAFYQKIGAQELAINNLTLPSVDPLSNRFSLNQGYGYDKNGNITTDPVNGNRTFTFNGDNKQTEVRDASNVTIGVYSYDGNGHRVKKVTNLETTVFVYNGTGNLVAEYSTATPPQNPTISYTATDKLGSPRVLTDKFGYVVSRRDFLPYGEEIYANSTAQRTEANKYSLSAQDSVRKRFTGYEKDTETGFDFAEARYYQNQHGRFTAVDPLLGSGRSADPQTFNRYVYVMNNPIRLVDPTGLQASTSEEDTVVARIQTWICQSFWCRVKEGFNKLVRSVMGRDNPSQDENTAFNERKRGGMQDIDKQVGNAVQNYGNDLNTVTETAVAADPTGVLNAQKVVVNNSLGRASDEEVYTAMASAGLNTAATVAPAGKLLGAGKLVKHHIFNAFRGSSPKSEVFRQFFKKHGINVDSFLVEIPEEMHKKFIHAAGNNWTTRWKEWIKANPNATTKEVYQFAGRLMDEYGLSGLPIIR